MNVIAALTEVWNPLSIVLAFLAGGVLGYFVIGRYASDPAYASGVATPVEYGTLTAFLAASIGLVFFSFQVLGTYVDGDPGWTRVVSRFAIWAMYSAAIGAGMAIRLKRHNKKKRDEAHERAVEETTE